MSTETTVYALFDSDGVYRSHCLSEDMKTDLNGGVWKTFTKSDWDRAYKTGRKFPSINSAGKNVWKARPTKEEMRVIMAKRKADRIAEEDII